MDLYNEHYVNMTKDYNDLLKKFNFDLIVYDETEMFRQSDDPQFEYPYQRQKNNLNFYEPSLDSKHYHHDEIFLRRSIVCL